MKDGLAGALEEYGRVLREDPEIANQLEEIRVDSGQYAAAVGSVAGGVRRAVFREDSIGLDSLGGERGYAMTENQLAVVLGQSIGPVMTLPEDRARRLADDLDELAAA